MHRVGESCGEMVLPGEAGAGDAGDQVEGEEEDGPEGAEPGGEERSHVELEGKNTISDFGIIIHERFSH